MSELKNKRTTVDFSRHVHTREIFKSNSGNEIIVDHFKIQNLPYNYISFTTSDSSTVVEGDRCNWVFDRPFLPSPDGYVSDAYWIEKLKSSSYQSAGNFSVKLTKESLEEIVSNFEDNYGQDKEIFDWLTDLIEDIDYMEEWEYINRAFSNSPNGVSAEDIPFCKEVYYDLKVVFDAFDEICKRLCTEEN